MILEERIVNEWKQTHISDRLCYAHYERVIYMKANSLQSSRISIIVPVYNVKSYLEKCIESIMGQTYQNLQVILVDDGSDDGSEIICDIYAERDARITVIHKPNGGLVSARKAGLEITEGEYVGFVDGDDFIDTQFYEILIQDMLEQQVDFVHVGYIMEQNGIGLQCFNYETQKHILTKEVAVHFIQDGILCSKGMNVQHGMVNNLFRKELIQKCYSRVPDKQFFGEDLACFCLCLLEGNSVYMHKLALYHYVKRDNSIMNTANIERIIQLTELQICLKNIFAEHMVYSSLQKCLDEWLLIEILSTLKKTVRGDTIFLHYYINPEMIYGKKIVIYGAGNVGQDYYLQLSKNPDCHIVSWVDANCQAYHFDYSEVNGIEQLQKLEFDIVLIALKSPELAMEVKEKLMTDFKIPETSILWEKPGFICAR